MEEIAMYHLAYDEQCLWNALKAQALSGVLTPADRLDELRCALRPAFHFHMGGLSSAGGQEEEAMNWFRAGSLEEGGMFNAVMAAFLDRNGGALRMPPAPIFSDPHPYEHFTTVPVVVGMRERFLDFAASSLPRFETALTILDVGCGDGSLLVLLLNRLLEAGRIDRIGRAILVDSSAAMLDLAAQKLSLAFPDLSVDKRHGRIQDHAATLPDGIDIALLSLAYHHMPWDEKGVHLRELAGRIAHLLLMEMDGDNDTPELHSPELAVSVYQSYGPIIDAIFAHDAPIAVSQGCVDNFIMAEVISFLTQPRGERNDYHMSRSQWSLLFADSLPGHYRRGEATVLLWEGCEFFACHWGKANHTGMAQP